MQDEQTPVGEWIEPAECSGPALETYIHNRLLSEGKVRHLIQALSVLTRTPVRLQSVGADHAVLNLQDPAAAVLGEVIAKDSPFHQQHGYYARIE